ncbi:MAG: TadE/TadG family type IV pilus assembly protein [Gemmobacter sp.]
MTRIATWAFRRFRRDERGSMTIEVALMLPLFITLLLCTVEAGMLMVRHTMLDRSLDMVVRDLRLGRYTNPTVAQLRNDICAKTVVMPNCARDVMLEMRPISRATWDVPTGRQPCIDRTTDIEPATTFIPGGANQLVIVRLCAIFNPLFPTTPWGLRLPLDASGGYQLLAMSTFVNEPR